VTQSDIERLEEEIQEWEFNIGELDVSFTEAPSDVDFEGEGLRQQQLVEQSSPHLKAELIDERSFGKTVLRTHEDAIRIYPREDTGIDQSIRRFAYIADHPDADAQPTQVS
jgi:hypothetical protein